MRFAHIADCHIGGWRDPKLGDLNTKAFSKVARMCIDRQMDFVLISGDLFNTSLPAIDRLKVVVKELKTLKDSGIPVYCIAGSHDFSPSGKTMIDVLESAGLCINVVKGSVEEGKLRLRFTKDPKTGVKIAGMLGRKGMLEKLYYEDLDRDALESEQGFKIFMFHTAITELKPKGMESMDSAPASFLPAGFDYYAGGHVHVLQQEHIDGRAIVFPGPLFPNNFKELEEQVGGFIIYEDGRAEHQPIHVASVVSHRFDCSGKTKEEIEHDILAVLRGNEFYGSIVTLRLSGQMSGKPGDLDFRKLFGQFYDKGALFVMKNTGQLTSPEFEEIKVSGVENSQELEAKLISEHLGQIPGVGREDEERIVKGLMDAFASEKQEGERLQDFTERVKRSADSVLLRN